MLDKVVADIVNESLDWFFKRVLKDHYDKHRQALTDANKNAVPAIDYILKTYIINDATYPPVSASEWNSYYLQQGSEHFKQLLLIYLKLDASSYLSQKENSLRTRTKDKSELSSIENALSQLLNIPQAFDFPNSVVQLGTGLWALDNNETSLIVSSLSNPSINLANYFESPKEIVSIIVDSLIISHKPQMALFMSKVHRHENWDEKYDAIYAFLLVKSGMLVEALKYERMFADRKNYHEILQRFFELCSEWNVTRSLNCLNLSEEEEDVLNQHLTSESRPVTPSGSQNRLGTMITSSSSKPKPRNRSIHSIQRKPSFNDSPARNTRSAHKKKSVK